MSSSPTRTLAEFIASTRYDDLPSSVIATAKDLVRDSLGCMIGSSELTPGRIVTDLFQEMGGVPESTVWVTGQRLPCLHATYVNAYLANLLDFDDTYSEAGHPGATVVPPALAVAEKVRATGREFLTSVVLAYEVSIRLGLAIQPSPARYRAAWGYGFQIFGAVTAASKLIRLDTSAIVSAFGLAGISASVPSRITVEKRPEAGVFTWPKNYYGWPAMGGVLAALQAARGFLANPGILDGADGFSRMFGSDRYDPGLMTTNLGQEFLMVNTEFKPYPTCRWTHSSLEALDAILAQHRIAFQDVSEVLVRSFPDLAAFCSYAVPRDIIEAQFSLPYLLALRLHGRSLTPALSEADLRNHAILDTAKKVTIEVDPDAGTAFFGATGGSPLRPSTVIVKTVHGQAYSQTVRSGRGGPDNRLTGEQLRTKFRGLVEPVVGSGCTHRMLATIERLDDVQDLRRLAECFPQKGTV